MSPVRTFCLLFCVFGVIWANQTKEISKRDEEHFYDGVHDEEVVDESPEYEFPEVLVESAVVTEIPEVESVGTPEELGSMGNGFVHVGNGSLGILDPNTEPTMILVTGKSNFL